MRVTSNTFPDALLGHLQRTTKDMNVLNEQLATGQRISKVSDDSASANRILDMQEEKNRITQFSKNAARAQNINNTTISQLQNLMQISDRVGELATLANGLTGADGLRAYSEEVDELIQHALQGANAKFNGEYIFGGSNSGEPPFQLDDGAGNYSVPTGSLPGGATIDYLGADEGPKFHLSETGIISPFTNGETNEEFAKFINTMVELRDALKPPNGDSPDLAAMGDIRKALEVSEDDLIFTLSRQGSVQMRIEFDLTLNKDRFTDLESNISSEADVDIAQTIVRLTQVQNAYQASLKSAGQMLNQSLLDYI